MNNITVIENRKSSLGTLEAKLAQLNKLAKRIGNDPLSYHVIREFPRTVKVWAKDDRGFLRDTGKTCTFTVCQVAIIGVAPVYADCIVAGYVEATEAGNIISQLGGKDSNDEALSQRLRGWASECDHCGSKRSRKGAFGIYREGQLYLVGSSCVAQFVGRARLNPAHLGEYLHSIDLLGDDGEEHYSGTYSKAGIDTYVAFVLAATAIAHVGFTSRKAAAAYAEACNYERSLTTTSEVMSQELHPEKGYYSKVKNGYPGCHPDLDPTLWEHSESDHAVAAAAIEWCKALPGKSDYEYNLINIANCTLCPSKRFGFVAAAVQGYLKSIGEAQVYEAKPKAPESQWVGQVGDKLVLEGITVKALRSMDGFRYGSVTTLHKFVDAQGNKISWFKSGSADVAEGDVVTLKGTVKATKDDPKWGKETQLTRCAITVQ